MGIVQAVEKAGDDAEGLAEGGGILDFFVVFVKARVPIDAVKAGIVVVLFDVVVGVAQDFAGAAEIDAVHLLLGVEAAGGQAGKEDENGERSAESSGFGHGILRPGRDKRSVYEIRSN